MNIKIGAADFLLLKSGSDLHYGFALRTDPTFGVIHQSATAALAVKRLVHWFKNLFTVRAL